MKIAPIRATGLLRTPMVQEAANREHDVTAVCRHPDAVIHCYSPRRDYTVNRSEPHRLATQAIIGRRFTVGY